jgi:esterase/lipase superfamily enzyme
VNYLEARAAGTRPRFREIILAAPDIDAEIFKNDIVPRIAGKGPRLTLYASRRDYALLTSSWLRCGLSRAGFIEEGKPLVVRGVETIGVSAVNTELVWGLLQGHSYVADRPALVQDMFELLRFGKGAGERSATRRHVSTKCVTGS